MTLPSPATDRPQAVILMGIPATGKTTFCKRYFNEETGYVRLSRDTLRFWDNLWRELWKCLSTRRSFVLDNTHVERKDRSYYIAMAAAAGYEISGYYLQSRVLDCVRRNEARNYHSEDEYVPTQAVLDKAARLHHPCYAEGFDHLYYVSWEGLKDYCISPWQDILTSRSESVHELAQRMRKNEPQTGLSETEPEAVIVRLDGRAFGSLTRRRFEKPFDERFRKMMVRTVHHLMQCGVQVAGAYHQSDEISLVLYGLGRQRVKDLTILAGEASAAFSLALGEPAAFDARFHFVHDGAGVRDYFRWRSTDCLRNTFNGYCYWTLRRDGMEAAAVDAKLAALSLAEKKAMLLAHGIDFDTLPSWQKYGSFYYSTEQEHIGIDPRTGNTVPYYRRGIIEVPYGG